MHNDCRQLRGEDCKQEGAYITDALARLSFSLQLHLILDASLVLSR
jgi:hypothetical protein